RRPDHTPARRSAFAREDPAMRILVTGSRSKLGKALVEALGTGHEIRTMDLVGDDPPGPTFVADGRDRTVASEAMAGCDALIHIPPLVPPQVQPEEIVDAGTRSTYNLIVTAPAGCRVILISNLGNFEAYLAEYPVAENWAPRPTSQVRDLTTYLAEITVRELARVRAVRAVVLRLGEVVDDRQAGERPVDPRWLHLEDAVQAVARALVYEHPTGPFQIPYAVFHVVGAGERTRFPQTRAAQDALGFRPQHDLTAGVPLPIPVVPPRDVRRLTGQPGGNVHRVAIFGARGALGTRASFELAPDHVLTMTDRLSVEDYAREPLYAGRYTPTAHVPPPVTFPPPHRNPVGSIDDPRHVREVVCGTDATVNASVLRDDPVLAFRCNVVGAYNIAVAAAELGIRRHVHSGPQAVSSAYAHDFDVSDDVPMRPGDHIYCITKYLAQEIWRVFAAEHDLEVMVVGGGDLAGADVGPTWSEVCRAIRLGLHVPSFPRPYEVFNFVSDQPNGKFSGERAARLLGFRPREDLQGKWLRRFGPTGVSR
ncbi:MAG: NAD-dependent epimerase/dehydratase family protein, partial [Candidatus Latescibacterota bacterium]